MEAPDAQFSSDDDAFWGPITDREKKKNLDILMNRVRKVNKRRTVGFISPPKSDSEEEVAEEVDLQSLMSDVSKLSIRIKHFTPDETSSSAEKTDCFLEKVSQILNDTSTATSSSTISEQATSSVGNQSLSTSYNTETEELNYLGCKYDENASESDGNRVTCSSLKGAPVCSYNTDDCAAHASTKHIGLPHFSTLEKLRRNSTKNNDGSSMTTLYNITNPAATNLELNELTQSKFSAPSDSKQTRSDNQLNYLLIDLTDSVSEDESLVITVEGIIEKLDKDLDSDRDCSEDIVFVEEANYSRYTCTQSKYEDISAVLEVDVAKRDRYEDECDDLEDVSTDKETDEEEDDEAVAIVTNDGSKGSLEHEVQKDCDCSAAVINRPINDADTIMHNIERFEKRDISVINESHGVLDLSSRIAENDFFMIESMLGKNKGLSGSYDIDLLDDNSRLCNQHTNTDTDSLSSALTCGNHNLNKSPKSTADRRSNSVFQFIGTNTSTTEILCNDDTSKIATNYCCENDKQQSKSKPNDSLLSPQNLCSVNKNRPSKTSVKNLRNSNRRLSSASKCSSIDGESNTSKSSKISRISDAFTSNSHESHLLSSRKNIDEEFSKLSTGSRNSEILASNKSQFSFQYEKTESFIIVGDSDMPKIFDNSNIQSNIPNSKNGDHESLALNSSESTMSNASESSYHSGNVNINSINLPHYSGRYEESNYSDMHKAANHPNNQSHFHEERWMHNQSLNSTQTDMESLYSALICGNHKFTNKNEVECCKVQANVSEMVDIDNREAVNTRIASQNTSNHADASNKLYERDESQSSSGNSSNYFSTSADFRTNASEYIACEKLNRQSPSRSPSYGCDEKLMPHKLMHPEQSLNVSPMSLHATCNSLQLNDTMEEVDRLLKLSEDQVLKQQTPQQSESRLPVRTKQFAASSEKTRSQNKVRTPKSVDKFDYIISPVSRYRNQLSPAPTTFKKPVTPSVKQSAPKNRKKTSTFADVQSPISHYLKNSPSVPLQQNATNFAKLPCKLVFPPVTSPSPGKENFQLPAVIYKPASKTLKDVQPGIKLPGSVKKLVPAPSVIVKHQGRTMNLGKMDEDDVQRKLQSNNLTIDGSLNMTGASSFDVSVLTSKKAVIK